ncbi:MAG: VOC family protein [Rhodospirillales bacterium]|nr:VOC family protein [Rhodospirillales bacterium]
MTQIGGHIAATRRRDVLGVHSLDLVEVGVPDLQPAAAFYRAFGLDVREEDNGLSLYTAGHAHRWAHFVEAKEKRLRCLRFGAFEDDMERFRQRVRERGIAEIAPPPGYESNGLWVRDPDGLAIEIRVAEKSSPNAKTPMAMVSAPAGTAAAPARSRLSPVRPRRLAHALLFSSDINRSLAFYEGVLGLRLSDRSGEGIAFMHAIHGSDHHMIAFARSTGAGLHHLSWDVASVDEIGLGAMQMADKGFSAGWGLGRHVLGSNYFHYVRDPWGSWSEYSADIDYIPADHDWTSADHPPEDAFYVWGPTPPADFVVNHEAES